MTLRSENKIYLQCLVSRYNVQGLCGSRIFLEFGFYLEEVLTMYCDDQVVHTSFEKVSICSAIFIS